MRYYTRADLEKALLFVYKAGTSEETPVYIADFEDRDRFNFISHELTKRASTVIRPLLFVAVSTDYRHPDEKFRSFHAYHCSEERKKKIIEHIDADMALSGTINNYTTC